MKPFVLIVITVIALGMFECFGQTSVQSSDEAECFVRSKVTDDTPSLKRELYTFTVQSNKLHLSFEQKFDQKTSTLLTLLQ